MAKPCSGMELSVVGPIWAGQGEQEAKTDPCPPEALPTPLLEALASSPALPSRSSVNVESN